MTNTTVQLLGYAGAVCNAISFIPQLLRVIKFKSARDISYSTFLIFGIGSGLWILYGIHFGAFPVIAANVVTLLLSFAIFLLKILYERQEAAGAGPRRPGAEAAVSIETARRQGRRP